MSDLSTHLVRYGTDAAEPERIGLRAGPLSLLYEGGDLRYIRLGDREIVRRVYVAVRDHNWDTIPALLSNVQIEQHEDTFTISYDATHQQRDIDVVWRGTISGAADGTISFAMEGEARSTFLGNRIGFCLLHPMRECAGTPCEVEHTDGTVEKSRFPDAISPHQPFFEIQAIAHEVQPNLWAEVRFSGDTFEMEDQRNWTDASYKTYSTPLAIPYPVEIARGTSIKQSVSISLRGDLPGRSADSTDSSLVTIALDRAGARAVPPVGLGRASHGERLSEREVARLKALRLAHLRADLDLTMPDVATALQAAADEARTIGVPLELVLFVSNNAARELEAFAALLPQVAPVVCRWLVLHRNEKTTGEQWVQLARRLLAAYGTEIPLGSGTNAYFTELNRFRPPIEALDLVCYSLNPQVHAFDNASLVETLEAQAVTITSARQFCGDLPLAITPVTLRPRFNPNATGPEAEPAPGELPSTVDARQMSLFGAGWTAISLKYLAESGVDSLTFYETTGWRGVMERESGSPLPSVFGSLSGAVFPLYHIFADLAEFAGGQVVPTRSSNSLQVDALGLRNDHQTRLLVANLSGSPQRVALHCGDGAATIRLLDETNATFAMQSPEAFRVQAGQRVEARDGVVTIDLLPYAVARVDMEM